MGLKSNDRQPIRVETVNPVVHEIEGVCGELDYVPKVVGEPSYDVYMAEIGSTRDAPERLRDFWAITTVEVMVPTPGDGWLTMTQNTARGFSKEGHDEFAGKLLDRLESLGIYHPQRQRPKLGFQA